MESSRSPFRELTSFVMISGTVDEAAEVEPKLSVGSGGEVCGLESDRWSASAWKTRLNGQSDSFVSEPFILGFSVDVT